MAHYRFYFLNDNRFLRSDNMDFEDDDAAGVTALTLLESADREFDEVEVWTRARLVGKYAEETGRLPLRQ